MIDEPVPAPDPVLLEQIQRRVLWLSTLMVHHANSRPNPDGTKVGGHQASSASVVSLMTALYFAELREGDVVATKARGSPEPARVRRAASLSEPSQEPGDRGSLDGLHGTGSSEHALRRPRLTLCRGP